jgi:ice-binding like protein/Big-like domain-containing protein
VSFIEQPVEPGVLYFSGAAATRIERLIARPVKEKRMRKSKFSQIWILAFFLAVVTAACGDPDRGTSGPGSPETPPAVVSASVLPPNGSSGICQNTVVTAIFDKAMNPATINTTTFTLASSGGSVTGTVTYDSSSNTATFTPASPGLALSTTYTATITTGAKDQFGNGLAADFSWMFMTAATACAGPPAVPLLTAGNFKVLAGSTVTSTTTPGTTITGGDLGLSPGTSVTGFPPGILTPPAVMHVADPTAAQAQVDLTAAYNYAAGIVLPAPQPLAGDLTGETLAEGTYKTATSTGILQAGGILTLTGNSSSVFVFQIGSTLTTLSTTQVVLTGGVLPSNVF